MPGIYLLIQDYKAKPKAETRWEAHNKHVDIQFIMRGAEAMGHAFRPTLNVEETYDPENDVAFYTGSGNLFRVDQGMFVIFFPQDAHRPGRMIGGPTAVRKVVVKIPVHYFPNVHIPPKM
jgi:YhcH/YjgK/YiaL family protein